MSALNNRLTVRIFTWVELQHPVQGIPSNDYFRRLTAMGPRVESITNHSFIPPDLLSRPRR
jgi:hypothetical protein